MNPNGKKARKHTGGNRFTLKRRGRHAKNKFFANNILTPSSYSIKKRGRSK